MKVFREYRNTLLDASDSNSDYAPVRNLTYSQAVILLGVPEEGREQFILDMDIEGMTNQELRKAVNDRTQVRQEKDQALQENADLHTLTLTLSLALIRNDGSLFILQTCFP